ncbi:hypothetical protein CSKR_105749 [Clonorchis sinensis]|uniref:Uncharacterized protein n=1 Tax=Clonorchis sinensis TaxID=79923 RepID=A0A8T1MGW0_CLOSI|nr:hypothetical protein CSKR_105749 [Clonorchis sinensis]
MSSNYKQSNPAFEGERTELHQFQSANRLVEDLQKLTAEIISNLTQNSHQMLSPFKDDGSHETFIQNKSIRIIVQRLQVLSHATHMVLQRMDRYRLLLEKLLCDIRADIRSNSHSNNLRAAKSREKAEDDVDKVLTAERQSLKRLKHTLEKYLARVQSSSQDLITVKTMLQGLLDEYAERLRKLSRCKRQSALATTNIRYASSSEGFSADSMNPRKLLTLVESFFQQALGLRKELDSLFARVPPFVRSTQNSVHQALLNNSAQLITRERDLVLLEMQQNQTRNRCLRMTHALVNQSGQPACKALKPVDKELVRLDEAKGQLDKEMHTIRRSIDADLHIARTRRKAETHRLCSRFAL